jgi:hypothetical protein
MRTDLVSRMLTDRPSVSRQTSRTQKRGISLFELFNGKARRYYAWLSVQRPPQDSTEESIAFGITSFMHVLQETIMRTQSAIA